MPRELAVAAFVRGAARSTAAEPWKAAVRPYTHRGISYPPAHRRQLLSISSTAPLDAAAWRHKEGVYFNRSATSLRAKATMSDYFSMYPVKPLHSHAASSSPEIRKAVPHLGRLAKISLLILVLHKMGRLDPPSDKGEKTKARVKVALLTVALLSGYITSKEKKWLLMLSICDGTMKIYKVFTEIVDLLSTFFK